MTLSEISQLVVNAPGIESGFVQHLIGKHRCKANRKPGGGGGFEYTVTPYEHFRIVLNKPTGDFDEEKAKNSFAEVEDKNIFTAVSLAFEKLELPLPPAIAAEIEARKPKGKAKP